MRTQWGDFGGVPDRICVTQSRGWLITQPAWLVHFKSAQFSLFFSFCYGISGKPGSQSKGHRHEEALTPPTCFKNLRDHKSEDSKPVVITIITLEYHTPGCRLALLRCTLKNKRIWVKTWLKRGNRHSSIQAGWLKWFGVLGDQVQTSDFRHLTPKGDGDELGSVSTLLQLRSPDPAWKSGFCITLWRASNSGRRLQISGRRRRSVCVGGGVRYEFMSLAPGWNAELAIFLLTLRYFYTRTWWRFNTLWWCVWTCGSSSLIPDQ